ncbi:hypothetical protein JHW43_001654 [Diplocarpon mali]|nr:hypothetical protein JHW43_001654 [Diplocarpon mali]
MYSLLCGAELLRRGFLYNAFPTLPLLCLSMLPTTVVTSNVTTTHSSGSRSRVAVTSGNLLPRRPFPHDSASFAAPVAGCAERASAKDPHTASSVPPNLTTAHPAQRSPREPTASPRPRQHLHHRHYSPGAKPAQSRKVRRPVRNEQVHGISSRHARTCFGFGAGRRRGRRGQRSAHRPREGAEGGGRRAEGGRRDHVSAGAADGDLQRKPVAEGGERRAVGTAAPAGDNQRATPTHRRGPSALSHASAASSSSSPPADYGTSTVRPARTRRICRESRASDGTEKKPGPTTRPGEERGIIGPGAESR